MADLVETERILDLDSEDMDIEMGPTVTFSCSDPESEELLIQVDLRVKEYHDFGDPQQITVRITPVEGDTNGPPG